jgi:UPF0271 protein
MPRGGRAPQHVKAHGALYNQAAKDLALAKAIAKATKDAADGLILLGLANSLFEQAAREEGVHFASEAFADRGYQADGTLVPRSKPGAMIDDLNWPPRALSEWRRRASSRRSTDTIVRMRPRLRMPSWRQRTRGRHGGGPSEMPSKGRT